MSLCLRCGLLIMTGD